MIDDIANVWPRGGLFAFSGADGETCHGEPFIAAGMKDGIGWRFWLRPRVAVMANVGHVRLPSRRLPTDFCLSDCWHCSTLYEDCEGYVGGAFVDRFSMCVSISFKDLPEGHLPELQCEPCGRCEDDITLVEGETWWLAICASRPDSARTFGVAISYSGHDEAVQRARAACQRDLPALITARREFYRGALPPDSLSGNNRRAYYKAISVQKVNIESAQLDLPCHWTTPDRMPHRHMWMWDSAFHALGLQHIDMDLAREALKALFSKQRDDGKILLAVQPGKADREEDDTQPPILAWSLCRLCERMVQTDFVGEIYPRVVRYLEWFENNRKNENGLYGWHIRQTDDPVSAARGGESGMDNSPRFDKAKSMTAVDLSSYMASEYWSLEKLARYLEREDDVAEWKKRRLKIAERVNELLWDDEARFYFDLDEVGEFISIKTSAGFLPMNGQIPDRDRAEALRMHLMNPNEFWAPFPVPSVSIDEPSFSNDMWRGPTWVNVNVLIYYGLMSYGFFQEARQLARISLQEIVRHYMQEGCFFEYYDAMGAVSPPELPRKGGVGTKGGVGFGVVADLHWTAASFVHLAHELG